jgi:hypothetical protein
MNASRVEPGDLVTYPFLLSAGMAYLYLPYPVSAEDADRLCRMIGSLVVDSENPDDGEA